MIATEAALLARYDVNVPRYTSYPTAAQFGTVVGAAEYQGWLGSLPRDVPISLYLHVPFCDALCLYCACNTAVVRHEATRRAYAASLIDEIDMVGAAIGDRREIAEIHWGGGTPTALPSASLLDVTRALRRAFRVKASTRTSMEFDPRHLPDDRLAGLAALGVSRASIGVQDTDPVVQRAVGRVQPLEMVKDCITRLRAAGIQSINCDLIYGLPFQTEASVACTAAEISALAPDRIAAFGYAHVPWLKKQQRLMPEYALPSPMERFRQRAAMEAVLASSGYTPVGLDHYALPHDDLVQAAGQKAVRRNFQGYTTDPAPILLGLGASAIGRLPQGYVQNLHSTHHYREAIRNGRLATTRGAILTEEDRLRGDVIDTIMCRGEVDLLATADMHGADPRPLLQAAESLRGFAADGLVRLSYGGMQVTPTGRPFLRTIAAVFDCHRSQEGSRHASAV